ncbi:hypothetical protein HFP72_28045 [Nocardiopsis sp. ARC36]
MTGYVQVSTATETREQAVDLAKSLVTAKLAAGAQIVGPSRRCSGTWASSAPGRSGSSC